MGIEKFDTGLLMKQLRYQENLVEVSLLHYKNNSGLKKKFIELGLFDSEKEIEFVKV